MTVFISTDPITGSSNDRALCTAVYAAARIEGNAVMVSGDFMNMNGLNSALGSYAGNVFMRVVSGIYQEELSKLNPQFLYPFRKGGDEMTYMLGGVTADAVQERLDAAKKRVDAFVQDAGLGAMQHKKYPDIAGVGFFTAVQDIDGAKHDFDETYNDLQNAITAQKKSLPPFTGKRRPVEDYINNFSTEDFDAAVARVKWDQDYKAPITIPSTINHIEPDENILEDRNVRSEDLKTARGMLMRADLYNLGGVNAALSPAVADKVIAHMAMIMQEEVRAVYPKASFYDAGAGIVDVLLPTDKEADMTRIKKRIHERLYEEILSKTAHEYTAGLRVREMHADGNAIIGQLPYKDGTHPGVGIVMSHTPVEPGHDVVETLSRIASVANIQKIHGAAFLERTTDGHYKRYSLFPVGQSLDHFDIIDNVDNTGPDNLPYANSLKERLTADMLKATFTKPCGMICQEVFGIDLTPVVARQKAIQEMIKSGVAEDEVIRRTDTMVQFDFWNKSRKKSINLHDRQETTINPNPALMTFSLAKRWKVLPDNMQNLPEMILLAQGALRTSQALESKATVSPHDSITYLEKDVRVHVANEQVDALRRIQGCEQALKALQHIGNYLQRDVPRDALRAAATIIRQSLDEVSSEMDLKGEGHLALLFREVRNQQGSGFNRHADIDEPERVLRQALSRGIDRMSERGIKMDVREKVIANLEILKEAIMPRETPAPEPAAPPPVQRSVFKTRFG